MPRPGRVTSPLRWPSSSWACGAWSSIRAGSRSPAPKRDELEGRRDRLYAELASIERQRQTAASDSGRAAANDRRRALISELESVYAALDS